MPVLVTRRKLVKASVEKFPTAMHVVMLGIFSKLGTFAIVYVQLKKMFCAGALASEYAPLPGTESSVCLTQRGNAHQFKNNRCTPAGACCG